MGSLAINGGKPFRESPFTPWPQFDEMERRQLSEVLESRQWGTLGPKVAEFETKFASYIGVEKCQTVSNGTVSLEVILRALGIGGGDEVIIPPYTFIATATAALMVAFYRGYLEWDNKAIALQRAMQALCANPEYAHPRYWAPFVVVGAEA